MAGRQLKDFGAQGTGSHHTGFKFVLVTQDSREAGLSAHKHLGNTRGVGVGEVDVHVVDLVEVQHGIGAGVGFHLLGPGFKASLHLSCYLFISSRVGGFLRGLRMALGPGGTTGAGSALVSGFRVYLLVH